MSKAGATTNLALEPIDFGQFMMLTIFCSYKATHYTLRLQFKCPMIALRLHDYIAPKYGCGKAS